MRYTALLVIILVTTISMAQAEEIYKWVDSTGKIHFGDTKPEILKVEKIDINIHCCPVVFKSLNPSLTLYPARVSVV
jgi:hypothetical protein